MGGRRRTRVSMQAALQGSGWRGKDTVHTHVVNLVGRISVNRRIVEVDGREVLVEFGGTGGVFHGWLVECV